MRGFMRVAVIVLAILGGLAIIQTLAGAGNRPQIVYVTAPAPMPAPVQQIVVRREVVQAEQSPAPEPVQYEALAPVEYAPPPQVYSAPMNQPVVIERESPHQTRNMVGAFVVGTVVGAIANRRGGYSHNRYGWGGSQGGYRGGRASIYGNSRGWRR